MQIFIHQYYEWVLNRKQLIAVDLRYQTSITYSRLGRPMSSECELGSEDKIFTLTVLINYNRTQRLCVLDISLT